MSGISGMKMSLSKYGKHFCKSDQGLGILLLSSVLGKGRKKMQEIEMGKLLANTMPAMSIFSQCLLKVSNRKHGQFQEDKQ